MKVYNLCCEHGHRFEGWFTSEDHFQAQQRDSQLSCPVCDTAQIVKMPSAPRLNLSARATVDPQVQLQARIAAYVRQVVAQTEDVGERFAEEARRMHYDEAPERAIRGVATPQECVALADEGIDVVPLPMPAPIKQTLQ